MKQDSNNGIKPTPLERFFKLLALEKNDIVLVYGYAILSGIIGLSLPLGIQTIMNLIMAGQSSTSWIVLVSIVIIGVIFSGSLQIMQLAIIEKLQQRIFARTAFELAFRIPRMNVELMVKKYAPELMNRFFDVMTIQKGLSKILVDFTASGLQIVFGLILLAFYHPFFAFYGILTTALLIIVFYLTSPKGLRTSLVESKHKYKVAHWLEELARSMNIFKLAGYTEMPITHTDKLVTGYVHARKNHWKVLINQYAYLISFKVLVTAGLLIIGSLLVFGKEITVGQFVASEIIIILMLGSIEKLLTTIETIYDVLTGLEKVGHVLDQEIETDKGIDFEDIDNGGGVQITFQDLSYTYPHTSYPALRNISLDVKSGEKICIAGFSGAGTSTLISIAASILHSFKGSMMINGVTIKNINLMSIRSYVGENLSNSEIMNGTIAENISMGRDDITMRDIIEATEAVGLKDFIQQLPDGYHTEIIQNDMTIPDSVAVKVNIARSVAENPKFFLMDKPLELLEKRDKILISDFLTDHSKDWTLLVASNDVTMASKCDRIFVLKEGKIIDQGTFEEVKEKPYFNELFER